MRQHRLHAVQRRLGVDLHHLVEVVIGQLRDEARDAPPGVVDPDVHVAEARQQGRERALNLLAPGDVRGERKRFRAAARGDLAQLLLAPREQRHSRTPAGHQLGERRTYPAARTRDDDNLAVHGSAKASGGQDTPEPLRRVERSGVAEAAGSGSSGEFSRNVRVERGLTGGMRQ